jgi:hypothetical protein
LERRDRAVELARDRPGITIPEMAEAMDIRPTYLSLVVSGLEKEGELRRDEGNGWYVAAGVSEAASGKTRGSRSAAKPDASGKTRGSRSAAKPYASGQTRGTRSAAKPDASGKTRGSRSAAK